PKSATSVNGLLEQVIILIDRHYISTGVPHIYRGITFRDLANPVARCIIAEAYRSIVCLLYFTYLTIRRPGNAVDAFFHICGQITDLIVPVVLSDGAVHVL